MEDIGELLAKIRHAEDQARILRKRLADHPWAAEADRAAWERQAAQYERNAAGWRNALRDARRVSR